MLGTGCGISSTVLTMVTGPLMLLALVEPLIGMESCDVRFGDKFAVQFNEGVADIVDTPDTVFEGFEAVEEAEVRGDPRATCNTSKLRTGSSHIDFILVSTYSVESGRYRGVGHFALDHRGAHVNRAPATRALQYTGEKSNKW